MQYNKLPDDKLWDEIVNNDPKAFAALFNQYWSKLFTTAFFHLKDQEACSEIVHDIFLNIWMKRDHLKIECFPNYLTAAVRYHIFKYIRSQKAVPLEYTEELEDCTMASCMNNGGDKLIYNELETEVYTYIKKLPKRCQEIFLLSRKANLSNDEIARQLGISKRTVENQLTYALQHLRISMKGFFVLAVIIGIVQ
jgi:RNA polymerase sigma-70 factor (family 1)